MSRTEDGLEMSRCIKTKLKNVGSSLAAKTLFLKVVLWNSSVHVEGVGFIIICLECLC